MRLSVSLAIAFGLLFRACSVAGVPLPDLGSELGPLNEKLDPSFEDARLVVSALTARSQSLAGVERQAMDELIGHVKQPFVAESVYLRLANLEPQHRAALETAQKKLKSLETNPPRRVGGAVDFALKDRLKQDANAAVIRAEKELAEIALAPGHLTGQLATTNSIAAAYQREGRTDIALALAGSLHAVASRRRLQLDFEPVLSFAWVRMSKLSPVQRSVEQDRAKRLLTGYVAMHEGARNVSGFGADALYESAKSGDLAGSLLSYALLQEGLRAESRLDKAIDGCLEIICFQPEPGDHAAKARLALNTLLEPIAGKSAAERFAENAVRDALALVEPRIATPEIAEVLAGILAAGAQLATAPRP